MIINKQFNGHIDQLLLAWIYTNRTVGRAWAMLAWALQYNVWHCSGDSTGQDPFPVGTMGMITPI